MANFFSGNGKPGDQGAEADTDTDVNQIAAGYIAQGKFGIAVQGGDNIEKELQRACTVSHYSDAHDNRIKIFFRWRGVPAVPVTKKGPL